MNLWGRGQQVLLFLLLALVACDDESYLLGFQSPDENFKVVYAEFTLPTSTYLIDSLTTSNLGSNSATNRLLVGTVNDPLFGKATAQSYIQFFPAGFPVIHDTAVYDKLVLKLFFDMYQTGTNSSASTQTFNFHALTDSLVNSNIYFSKSVVAVEPGLLGTTSRAVSPAIFDEALLLNNDNNSRNDVYDSIVVELDRDYGLALFAAIRSQDSVAKLTYRNFSRWRKIFKGIGILPGTSDKIVGFMPQHTRSGLTLTYREAGQVKQVTLVMSPVSGLASHSSITVDRSGTPVGGITSTYENFEPTDGMRYVQSGGGLLTRIDLKPVYDYFEDIPLKSLNVAEISLTTDQQLAPPVRMTFRAVKPDNRTLIKTSRTLNEAYDSVSIPDYAFVAKHYISSASAPRADMLGDDGQVFTFEQKSNTAGVATYKGYLANFLQREVDLVDKDYLRYFSIMPSSPEFGKSVNGLYFHKDSVKLRIFYTTPIPKE
jgi:hypothetical protein